MSHKSDCRKGGGHRPIESKYQRGSIMTNKKSRSNRKIYRTIPSLKLETYHRSYQLAS